MKTPIMDLQKLNFFTEGNTFTGSKSGEGKILRYLVKPDKDEGKLIVYRWPEDVCFEKAAAPEMNEFSLDEEGLNGVDEWLFSGYEEIKPEGDDYV